MPNNRFAKTYAAKPHCWKCDSKKSTFVDEGGRREYTCVECGATWNDLLPSIPNYARENAPPRGGHVPGLPTHGKRSVRDDY